MLILVLRTKLNKLQNLYNLVFDFELAGNWLYDIFCDYLQLTTIPNCREGKKSKSHQQMVHEISICTFIIRIEIFNYICILIDWWVIEVSIVIIWNVSIEFNMEHRYRGIQTHHFWLNKVCMVHFVLVLWHVPKDTLLNVSDG